jgi:hypothetical protein
MQTDLVLGRTVVERQRGEFDLDCPASLKLKLKTKVRKHGKTDANEV